MDIFPGIKTSGEIPPVTPYEKVDEDLLVKNGSDFKQDVMADVWL